MALYRAGRQARDANFEKDPRWKGILQTSMDQLVSTDIKGNPHAAIVDLSLTKVVDGDTIEIEGGQRIRYIGIDTPETVHPQKPVQCFGREASASRCAVNCAIGS